MTALSDLNSSTALPEGFTVLETLTGDTYTVAGISGRSWVIEVLPEPHTDGIRFSMLPTDESALVDSGTTL
ncbi:hypothetical protein F7P69_00830 [Cellulosimicrobium funkei]|nr:hypothetical protein [Cellulosimicrobium funkei]